MNYKIDKTDQYVLISLDETTFGAEITPAFEKLVVQLYREGSANMVVDFTKITDVDNDGLTLIGKITKVCRSEQGLFVICTKDDNVIDEIDSAKIPELIILPTVDEGIDAVFMNDLENDFRDEKDEDFDLGEENGFQEGKF
jgi:anti-anti-sigma regulatory factor